MWRREEGDRESYVLCGGFEYIYFIFNLDYARKLQYFEYYLIYVVKEIKKRINVHVYSYSRCNK